MSLKQVQLDMGENSVLTSNPFEIPAGIASIEVVDADGEGGGGGTGGGGSGSTTIYEQTSTADNPISSVYVPTQTNTSQPVEYNAGNSKLYSYNPIETKIIDTSGSILITNINLADYIKIEMIIGQTQDANGAAAGIVTLDWLNASGQAISGIGYGDREIYSPESRFYKIGKYWMYEDDDRNNHWSSIEASYCHTLRLTPSQQNMTIVLILTRDDGTMQGYDTTGSTGGWYA